MYSNEQIILKIKDGNLELKATLIENNTSLIYKIISEFYYIEDCIKEDLFQAGSFGLIKALDRYNPNYGTKFTTFAYKYIKGEILRVIEQEFDRELTFTEVFSCESKDKDYCFEDIADYVANVINGHTVTIEDKVINKILVNKILDIVTPKQKEILKLRYFENKTQQEIGELMGIHQVEVSREEQRAKRLVCIHFNMKEWGS